MNSKFFRTLYYGQLAEKHQNEFIEIKECQADDFDLFLNAIYPNSVEITGDQIFQIDLSKNGQILIQKFSFEHQEIVAYGGEIRSSNVIEEIGTISNGHYRRLRLL